MNIFYSNHCPILCASYLDDKRVVKMVLETAQILSTAVRSKAQGEAVEGLYRSTHKNHPCVVWASQSYGNFAWLVEHFAALLNEYSKRYEGRIHASTHIYDRVKNLGRLFPTGPFTLPPNCTRNLSKGIDYTKTSDVVIAYKQYLDSRWQTDARTPTWYGEE
jgi:hypothetical protein